MKHIIFLPFLVCFFSFTAADFDNSPIIPRPVEIKAGKGYFDLTAPLTVYTDLTGEEKEYIHSLLDRSDIRTGYSNVQTGSDLKLIVNPGMKDEGYGLRITAEEIVVEAKDGRGMFYALQSLLQLAHACGGRQIPCLEITDAPRFGYRGFMLDVSRHFASVDFIKKQLDIMSCYKLNVFHWHLTDGAGWRMEVKKYPELTGRGAWRPVKDYKEWIESGKPFCEQTHPSAYGGCYTQDEIREVVRYAAERFITVIPEIEMPAHSEEVLAVYPHLSCYGGAGMNSEFCIGNEQTFVFLTDVLSEVMELFPSPYIHIGGDEAGTEAWSKCPKCQQVISDNSLKNEYELQGWLIRRVGKFLGDHGKTLIGWDEILDGGLAPDAVVMSWRGEEGGIRAAAAGHNVIMTPGAYCYIDSYQDAPPTQPDAMAGYLPLDKVYGYDPVPKALQDNPSSILGVQANLWREWIQSHEHTEMMMYPRLLALAETAWTPTSKKDPEDFRKRVLPAVEYLKSKGVNCYDIANEVGERKESVEDIRHLAAGKPVVYRNPYHEKYKATGQNALTDGRRGTWSYSDGRWQGFLGTDIDVIIDLEQVQEIKSVNATFLQEYHAWIWLPQEVNIYVSNDAVSYELLATVTHDLPVERTGYHLKDLGWEGHAEARYIRYEAKITDREGGWLFTDEIVVR